LSSISHNKLNPAFANIIASYSLFFNFYNLVFKFPLITLNSKLGWWYFKVDYLLNDDVPIIALFFNNSSKIS